MFVSVGEKAMTIDERLEALTHSVELIAAMQQTTENNLAKFTAQTDRFEEFARLVLANHEERIRKFEV
jgi:hypothetical protein